MSDLETNRRIVRKMQKTVYAILCDIDDFCRENHIQYFLSGGSCLGAIRHHGFIPWDDDADIMMPRRDYERFMTLFPAKYGDKYGVGALAIDPKWNRQWGKVWDLKTSLKYKYINNYDIGVFVDVYPIDGLPRTALGRKLFYASQKVLLELGIDCERKSNVPHLRFVHIRRFVNLFTRHLGARFFLAGVDGLARRFDFDRSEYVACSVPVHYGARETIRREHMAQAVMMPFEDRMLPVPIGYDTYLSNLYGDYMRIPEGAQEEGFTHLNQWEVTFDSASDDDAEPLS